MWKFWPIFFIEFWTHYLIVRGLKNAFFMSLMTLPLFIYFVREQQQRVRSTYNRPALPPTPILLFSCVEICFRKESQLPSLISLFILVWSISEANPKNNWMRGEQACLFQNTYNHILWLNAHKKITKKWLQGWGRVNAYGQPHCKMSFF